MPVTKLTAAAVIVLVVLLIALVAAYWPAPGPAPGPAPSPMPGPIAGPCNQATGPKIRLGSNWLGPASWFSSTWSGNLLGLEAVNADDLAAAASAPVFLCVPSRAYVTKANVIDVTNFKNTGDLSVLLDVPVPSWVGWSTLAPGDVQLFAAPR